MNHGKYQNSIKTYIKNYLTILLIKKQSQSVVRSTNYLRLILSGVKNPSNDFEKKIVELNFF